MTNKDWHKLAIELDKENISWRKIAKIIGKGKSTISDFLREYKNKQNVHQGYEGTLFLDSKPIGNITNLEVNKNWQLAKKNKLGKKIIYIPDTQCKPGISLEYLRWIGEYIAEKKPDIIVHAGDHADMESLSSYDKGKKSAEGKRVNNDIEAAIKGMQTLLAPIERETQKSGWKPRKIITLGNHECLPATTEVLTDKGFLPITDVTGETLVAQRGVDGKTVWGKPKGFVQKHYSGKMYNFNSRSLSLSCTENHRVVGVTSGGNLFDKKACDLTHNFEIFTAAEASGRGVALTDEQLQLGAWLCTDSYHPTEGNVVIIYQRESNAHKIRELLTNLGISFTEKTRVRDIKEICGKILKKPCENAVEFYINKLGVKDIGVETNKKLPIWAKDLDGRQWSVFLETCIDADGTIPTKASKSRVFYGKYEICSDMQAAASTHGWSASLTEYRPNQWRVNLCKRTSRRQENITPKIVEVDEEVYCLVTQTENFIIRQNNKVCVTGNCRIMRHVEANPELEGFLGYDNLQYKKMGWEVYDFLEPAIVEGICFIHYFPNPMTGKPYGGSAANMLQKIGTSFVQGHKQTLDVATRTLHTGEHQWGIIAGAAYMHSEGYKGYTGNKHFRGIITLHNVKNGSFDPMFVGLDYLQKRYGK